MKWLDLNIFTMQNNHPHPPHKCKINGEVIIAFFYSELKSAFSNKYYSRLYLNLLKLYYFLIKSSNFKVNKISPKKLH